MLTLVPCARTRPRDKCHTEAVFGPSQGQRSPCRLWRNNEGSLHMAKESGKSPANPFFPRQSSQRTGTTKTAASPSASSQSSTASATATATQSAPATPTHVMIADRARAIWKAKGCPSGRDRENWLEAESQLMKEMKNR
jgi:hypothetical protein